MDQAGSILERISGLAEQLQLASLRPLIAACRKQFDDSDRHIDVAVFGRFKAGKSSFLNHLTDREVLPVGVVPLTAVITRLRFGPREQAVVQMLDGSTTPIPLQDIGLYVAEKENPGNLKQVASVDVDLPTLQSLDPLAFVDTPGLDSAFTHNSETTFRWLPQVGAALLAASCDAPLSEGDLNLLDELRRNTPRVILLLTKADLLDEEQRAEVLAFVRQQIFKKWEEEIQVYFYSVQPEYKRLKEELETTFLLPLVRNHDEVADQISRYKLLSLVARTLDYLNIALAATTQLESSRSSLRAMVADERHQFDLFREELQVLTFKWSADALNRSLETLRPQQKALQERITAQLLASFPDWPSRLPQLLKTWRGWLQTTLDHELDRLSEEEREIFVEPLKRVEVHLTRMLQALQNRLAEHVRNALGITLVPHEIVLEVPEPEPPPIDIAHVDAAFNLISPFIPMILFRSPIERKLLQKSRWETEKNLSRLASDWRDRVAKTIKQLTIQAEQYAMDELRTLEHLLEQNTTAEPELHGAIKELERAKVDFDGGD